MNSRNHRLQTQLNHENLENTNLKIIITQAPKLPNSQNPKILKSQTAEITNTHPEPNQNLNILNT